MTLEIDNPESASAPLATAALASFEQALLQLAERWADLGACGLLLIDASPLESIERRYGIAAYRQAREHLAALVREVTLTRLPESEFIVARGPGRDEIVVFLLRPRGDDGFYRCEHPALAELLGASLARNGTRIVYPYSREVPVFPIGTALALHNPALRAERQIGGALDQARQDAELQARIDARARSRRFVDVVLSEDVRIVYEPIVRLATREVLGYEALARGPMGTPLQSPRALFSMGEETGLVFELDCLCRRKAMLGSTRIPPRTKLFLNCLPTAIHDPSFHGAALERTLESLGRMPSDVVFEISEKESIENFTIFREARDYYAGLGFQIALDDTGVAYSSLEAVMELSPDFIKVDLALVRGIDTDPPRQELLRALHAVAGKLGAKVIAEGVETAEELATLQRLGIPFGQGYLLGRASSGAPEPDAGASEG